MSDGSILVYNGFNELEAAQGGGEVLVHDTSVWNAPHIFFADGKGGVDFRIEFYALPAYNITDEATKDDLYRSKGLAGARMNGTLFYADIPQGFTGFPGRTGDVVVFDGNHLHVCFKNTVDLTKHIRLPDGWERAADISTE